MSDYKVRIKQLLALREKDTIEHLAEISGVNAGTIRSWFHRQSNPKANDMVAIAHALGTSVEYLMTGVEAEPSRKYDNPVEEEICEYVRGLDRNTLLEIRGYLKGFNVIKLGPQLPKVTGHEKGGQQNRREA